MGYDNVEQVRIGKYIELRLSAADENKAREQLDRMCNQLANPVIENYRFDLIEVSVEIEHSCEVWGCCFPGSNCDRDVAYVTRDLLNQPTRMVWHEETDISDLDVVVLVASAMGIIYVVVIARFSPVMRRVVEHAQQGKFVLGICNGFQVLTEAGLLPGVLVRNRDLHFICDRVPVKVERSDLA